MFLREIEVVDSEALPKPRDADLVSSRHNALLGRGTSARASLRPVPTH